jgi:hypothetical protein
LGSFLSFSKKSYTEFFKVCLPGEDFALRQIADACVNTSLSLDFSGTCCHVAIVTEPEIVIAAKRAAHAERHDTT